MVSAVPENTRLLTTKTLVTAERNTAARPISDGLNAVPTTNIEKMDCLKELTPQVGVLTSKLYFV